MNKCIPLLCGLLIAGGASAAKMSPANDYNKENEIDVYLRLLTIDTRLENDRIESRPGGFPHGDRVGATALGLAADYHSAYFYDWIGFEGSFYGVAGIDSREDSRSLLNDRHGDNHGFGYLGQSYVKMRHLGAGWSADMQAGRGRLDVGTIRTKHTRAIPGSVQGVRGHLDMTMPELAGEAGKLRFEAGLVDKTSPRDIPDYEELASETDQPIDFAYSYAVSYKRKRFEGELAQGVARDFNRNTRYRLTYRLPLSKRWLLLLNGQYYDFQKNGHLWREDVSAGKAAYADHADWLNLNVLVANPRFHIGLSHSRIHAKLEGDRVGYAYYDHASNLNGKIYTWTSYGNDFNNDGESVWQLLFNYKLNGYHLASVPLDGFEISGQYRQGSFDAPNPFAGGAEEKATERLSVLGLSYYFDERTRKGLSMSVSYARYTMDKDYVVFVAAQSSSVVTNNEIRFYLDYAF